jgi:hypothetical protein
MVKDSTDTYIDSTLKTGDSLKCLVTTVLPSCAGPSPIMASDQYVVKAYTVPAAPAAITGPASVHSGQQNLYYSVTAVKGLTYIWTLPAGALIDSGQGGNKIKVSWGSSGGTVSVIAVNSCGASQAKTITVSVVSGVSSAINAFTQQEAIAATSFTLKPNPARKQVLITFTALQQGDYSITILNTEGKTVLVNTGTQVNGTNTVKLNIGNLPAGAYFVAIHNKENNQQTQKLIIGD